MSTILLATDGSPSANRALTFAVQLAARLEGELVLATVMSPADIEDLRAFGHAEQSMLGDVLEGERHKILAAARTKATSMGAAHVRAVTKHGDPATAILELAHELPATTIVVGRRGRGRLEGMLLGSVSQKLVTLAPCPVTVVP